MFMKLYTVFIPQRANAQDAAVFVKEGFNGYAFVFGIFWAIYHRIWKLVLLIVLFNAMMVYMGNRELFSPLSLAVMQAGFQAIIGLHANDWLRSKLKSRGYVFADMVSGTSLPRAWQRYFDRIAAGNC